MQIASPQCKKKHEHTPLLPGTESPTIDEQYSIALLARGNIAIGCVFFTLGFCLAFPGVALLQFLRIDLAAAPATQTLVGVIQVIPFNLKVFVAFASDCVPIWGQRRKPYMVGGVIVLSASWLLLSLAKPSLGSLCVLLLGGC